MDLNAYSNRIKVDIVIRYHHNQNRWTAKLDYVSVIEDGKQSGVYGNGLTAQAAMNDYANKIAGKRIVDHINAVKYDVPENLMG